MTHTVRTSYGDYNLKYGGETITEEFRHFMMVLYQGHVSDPQIWLIISSVVFSELREQGLGINLLNSIKT